MQLKYVYFNRKKDKKIHDLEYFNVKMYKQKYKIWSESF